MTIIAFNILLLWIGELSDNHDILSMKMFELENAATQDTDQERRNAVPSSSIFEPPRDHVEDPKPSAMSGILKYVSTINWNC